MNLVTKLIGGTFEEATATMVSQVVERVKREMAEAIVMRQAIHCIVDFGVPGYRTEIIREHLEKEGFAVWRRTPETFVVSPYRGVVGRFSYNRPYTMDVFQSLNPDNNDVLIRAAPHLCMGAANRVSHTCEAIELVLAQLSTYPPTPVLQYYKNMEDVTPFEAVLEDYQVSLEGPAFAAAKDFRKALKQEIENFLNDDEQEPRDGDD